MSTGLFGEGSLSLTWTGVRGMAGVRPSLAIKGRLVARGYSPGAVILISAEITATQLTKGNNAYLGSTAPLPVVLQWVKQHWATPNPPPPDETQLDIEARMHLDAAAVEALEERRQGRDFYLQVDTTVLLVGRGTGDGPREGEEPPAHYNTHPVIDWQEQLPVPQHAWGQVLQQWERGVGIPLVVPLAEAVVDPSRAEVVRWLRQAWQAVDGGDYAGSIASSRKALELLRGLGPAGWPLPAPKDQNVDQRVRGVIDALFHLASAPAHVDGATKDFEPQRSDAVAAAGAAAAMAQAVFARLKSVSGRNIDR